MRDKIQELYALEQLAGGNTCIHRLHPVSKLLATTVFVITVVSFNRYSFLRLVPYIFYPMLITALSETPYAVLLKRFLIPLPFCLFAGFANMFFDRACAFAIGSITVSFGAVSLLTILLRVYLCVMAILLLVSSTPLSQIINSMRLLKIPHIFAVVFEMTYRYISVLFEEAYLMYVAYTLRSANSKGIRIGDMGSFVGQLLIRSIDRADRVYNAMKCRGYALNSLPQSGRKWIISDAVFLAVTCVFCVICRFVDVNMLLTIIFGVMP